MSSSEISDIIARAIQSEVAQPLGSMRFLPGTDEQVALAIIDALDQAGLEIVRRAEPTSIRD